MFQILIDCSIVGEIENLFDVSAVLRAWNQQQSRPPPPQFEWQEIFQAIALLPSRDLMIWVLNVSMFHMRMPCSIHMQSLNTISLQYPDNPLCLSESFAEVCESLCVTYCDRINAGYTVEEAFSEICRRPLCDHVGFPADIRRIIPQLVDDVCLPLQRLSLVPCLPVLESFMALSAEFQSNLIENYRIGRYQPSAFVIKGMSSALTKTACMEYVRLAQERITLGLHGKVDPSVALFFHGQDSIFVLGARCLLSDLGNVIQAVKDQQDIKSQVITKMEEHLETLGLRVNQINTIDSKRETSPSAFPSRADADDLKSKSTTTHDNPTSESMLDTAIPHFLASPGTGGPTPPLHSEPRYETNNGFDGSLNPSQPDLISFHPSNTSPVAISSPRSRSLSSIDNPPPSDHSSNNKNENSTSLQAVDSIDSEEDAKVTASELNRRLPPGSQFYSIWILMFNFSVHLFLVPAFFSSFFFLVFYPVKRYALPKSWHKQRIMNSKDAGSLQLIDFECFASQGDAPTIKCNRELHLLSCELCFVFCK